MTAKTKRRPAKKRPGHVRVVARLKATKGQPVRIGGKLIEVSREVGIVVLEEKRRDSHNRD